MFEKSFLYTQQGTVDDAARSLTYLNEQAAGRGDTNRIVNIMPMGKEIHFHIAIERQGRFVSYTTANAEGRIYETAPDKIVVEGQAGMSFWMFLFLVGSMIFLFLYMFSLASKDPAYPTGLFTIFLLGVGVAGFFFLYYEQMKTLNGIQEAMSIVPRLIQIRLTAEAAKNAQIKAVSEADPKSEAARINTHLKKW